MSKFKVGDKVRALEDCGWSEKGCVYTISKCWYNATHNKCYVRLEEHLSKSSGHSHYADMYELVETNPVLTPEEVFEHLRKGTQLQRRRKDVPSCWIPVGHAVYVHQIDDYYWRIKPEPEVIELNGKKYREITE